jgi:HEAT repeat protein
MAKSAAIDQMLTKLGGLRNAFDTPEVRQQLAQALDSKVDLIVERAARIISDRKISGLAPDLIRAFDRHMPNGADKGCGAKTAIAHALYEMGADAAEVFLVGIRHVQLEPAWDGAKDAAAELRGVCALGLVRIGHRDALLHASDLLTDAVPQARMIAARALAYSGHDSAALPLRVKVRSGDAEPEVVSECITALMKLSPQKSITLVSEFLDDPDEMIRESAALALGESRRREAFDALRDHSERTPNAERRRPLLLGIAVSRLPEAIEYLVELLGSSDLATARHVLDALKIYRHDESIRAAVQQSIEKRTEPSLKEKFADEFSR